MISGSLVLRTCSALILSACTLTEDPFEPATAARGVPPGGVPPGGELPDGEADTAGGSTNDPLDRAGAEVAEATGVEGQRLGAQELPASEVDDAAGAESADLGAADDRAAMAVDAGTAELARDAGCAFDASPASSACETEVFEGSCYEFFDDLVIWTVAAARCQDWGGHLARVASDAPAST